MWEFIGIVFEQLGETFRWFFTGFLGTIVILILLYKNNLLHKSGSLGFLKKISYYLFFPIYIGVISWFFSATYYVEKDATKLAEITIKKAQDSLFPEFYTYIVSLADEYLDGKITSKEELVDNYLSSSGYKEGNLSTTAMRWTLTNGLSLIENKAIENGNLTIADKQINFPQLISDYLSGDDNIALIPFKYLKGMSYKAIHRYATSFYWIYFWMAMVVVFILSLDIYLTLKNKEKINSHNPIDPSKTLENKQARLDNKEKLLDGVKKIQ